ncbi:Phage tail protein [compost metagenome]
MQEWWEEVPLGVPGTFRLLVGVLDTGITDEMYTELSWLIDDAKPLTRHLVGLAISLDIAGSEYIGAVLTTGDELDIYPPAARDIEVSGTLAWGAREHVIDSMDIY